MTKRTTKGEALTELILEIFRINGELLEAGNRLTAPHGLTSARWQVLGAIEIAGQPLTVSQIARRMGLARQGVQRIINDLEKKSFVVASNNLDHKRAPLFSISPTGQQTMSKIELAQSGWINELSIDLSERKLKQAVQLIVSVRDKLQNSKS